MQKKGLPAIISSGVPSNWESCRVIVPNLLCSYERAFGAGQFRYYHYSEQIFKESAQTDFISLLSLAQKIFDARPDRIIFTDHAPHPYPLLEALAFVYADKPMPPLYFHLFGDFILYAPYWDKTQKLLMKKKVGFIGASERQKNLLSKFLINNNKRPVFCCPFPVDTKKFTFDYGAREKFRKRLKISSHEFLFIYSGRISFQKNVVSLTQYLSRYIEQTSRPIRFVLAGRFDNFGAPYFSYNPPAGYNFLVWEGLVRELAPRVSKKIQYVGYLNATELAQLYNAADCQMSLSLYHDEDYGMSPVEGLCCGAPAILTSWGGYASFAGGNERDCSLVDVTMSKRGFQVNKEELMLRVDAHVNNHETLKDRKMRAIRYHSKFSIDAVGKVLTQIHLNKLEPHFEGFNWKLGVLAKHCQATPVFFPNVKENSFYHEIYSAYVRE